MSDAERPEVVLVSVAELGGGAHEAHFRALARRLSRHALVHEIAFVSWRMFLTPRGRQALAQQRSASEQALSGRFVALVHEPRMRRLLWSAHALRAAVRRVATSPSPILHCREGLATHVAAGARRAGLECRILFDVRGDRVAEVVAHGGEAPPEVVLGRELDAMRSADAHACVSRVLAAKLRAEHGVEAEVFPCAADTDRFRPDEDARGEVRAALGVGERFLLGYVGSAAGWQRPDAVAALHARLRAMRDDSLLLVLTPDVEAWSDLLEARGIAVDRPDRPRPGSSAHVRRAAHDAVPRYLAALDATALLRDRDAVNAVASPIKFGESLACGVPVLATAGIGDASGLVEERGLGAVFEDALLEGRDDASRLDSFLARVATGRRDVAGACRAAAESSWSWNEAVPRWRRLYDRLWAQRAVPGNAT